MGAISEALRRSANRALEHTWTEKNPKREEEPMEGVGAWGLYDKVQELVAINLPMIFLVSPNVLVGAKTSLGNFRPAVLDPHTLWNVEELFWRGKRTSGTP